MKVDGGFSITHNSHSAPCCGNVDKVCALMQLSTGGEIAKSSLSITTAIILWIMFYFYIILVLVFHFIAIFRFIYLFPLYIAHITNNVKVEWSLNDLPLTMLAYFFNKSSPMKQRYRILSHPHKFTYPIGCDDKLSGLYYDRWLLSGLGLRSVSVNVCVVSATVIATSQTLFIRERIWLKDESAYESA